MGPATTMTLRRTSPIGRRRLKNIVVGKNPAPIWYRVWADPIKGVSWSPPPSVGTDHRSRAAAVAAMALHLEAFRVARPSVIVVRWTGRPDGRGVPGCTCPRSRDHACRACQAAKEPVRVADIEALASLGAR